MERKRHDKKIADKIADLYSWLDARISQTPNCRSRCNACGKCCDFETFDHRLFITSPELIYLKTNLPPENILPMPAETCPYNIDAKCRIYPHRFASCRIFSCRDDNDLQSQLTEAAITKLRSICCEFNIPYSYTDLKTALNLKNPAD